MNDQLEESVKAPEREVSPDSGSSKNPESSKNSSKNPESSKNSNASGLFIFRDRDHTEVKISESVALSLAKGIVPLAILAMIAIAAFYIYKDLSK